MERRFVTVNGRQVHYARAGRGLPVVLLHASPGDWRPLRVLAAELSRSFTVYALDTPGHGGSDPLPHPDPDIACYGAALGDTLTALGLERAHLYGTHTGAKIALSLAVARPGQVASLVLDGIGVSTPDERADQLARYLPPVVPRGDGGHLVAAWHQVRNMFLYWPWYDERAAVRLTAAPPPPSALHDMTTGLLTAGGNYPLAYRAAFTCDPLPLLAGLAVPTLILASPADPLHAHLSRLPAHRLRIETSATTPTAVAARIHAHVTAQPPTAPALSSTSAHPAPSQAATATNLPALPGRSATAASLPTAPGRSATAANPPTPPSRSAPSDHARDAVDGGPAAAAPGSSGDHLDGDGPDVVGGSARVGSPVASGGPGVRDGLTGGSAGAAGPGGRRVRGGPDAPGGGGARDRVVRRYVPTRLGQVLVRYGGRDRGRPLVVLPPAPASGRAAAGLLAAAGRQRPVFALDLPGTGGSDLIPGFRPEQDRSTGGSDLIPGFRPEQDRSTGGSDLIPGFRPEQERGTGVRRGHGGHVPGDRGGEIAGAIADCLEALGLDGVDLYGTGAGAVFAGAVARLRPGRVRALALAGLPDRAVLTEAEVRARTPVLEPDDHGTHLLRAWHLVRDGGLSAGLPELPDGRPDLDELHARVLDVARSWRTYAAAFRAAVLDPGTEPAGVPVVVADPIWDPFTAGAVRAVNGHDGTGGAARLLRALDEVTA